MMEQVKSTDITDEDRKEIQRSFRVLDVDKNDQISEEEVINGMRVLGMNPTAEEAKAVIKEISKSEKRCIRYPEYEKVMVQQLKNKEKEKELFLEAFEKFDKNKDGFIDFDELKAVLCGKGDKMSDAEVDEFFKEADLNKDGKINYKEFVDYFNST